MKQLHCRTWAARSLSHATCSAYGLRKFIASFPPRNPAFMVQIHIGLVISNLVGVSWIPMTSHPPPHQGIDCLPTFHRGNIRVHDDRLETPETPCVDVTHKNSAEEIKIPRLERIIPARSYSIGSQCMDNNENVRMLSSGTKRYGVLPDIALLAVRRMVYRLGRFKVRKATYIGRYT